MPRHLTKIMLFAGACMALAVPANAETNWSGYGELSGGIGPSFSSAIKNCSGIYCSTHYSNTPTDMAGCVHVSMVFDSGLSLQFDAEGNSRFLGGSTSSYIPNFGRVTKYGVGVHLDATGD